MSELDISEITSYLLISSFPRAEIDSPIAPIPLFVFRRGVQAALPVIDDGWKVLAHCRAGIHRSVAMACCILIAKGYSSQEAVDVVKRQRAVAKPDDAHILARIKKFEAER